MTPIPIDDSFDATLDFLSDGYLFISKRCRQYQSDIFQTRLMLQRAVCMLGEEAARVFYEPERFTRRKAMPKTALKLLQDRDSVQLMDGEVHRHRKQMFMGLMNAQAIDDLANEVAELWPRYVEKWSELGTVTLHNQVEEILTRAACRWAGVPLQLGEVEQRTREFAAMIGGAGAVGPRNWWGMVLRSRAERWLRDFVGKVRLGDLEIEDDRPAHAIIWHQNREGKLLDVEVAAVELLNLLRPTVAVSYYITFAALALHRYPRCEAKLHDNDEYSHIFAQEVRRFYPFFPVIGGRVQEPFEWCDYQFTPGEWVLLDLYGTNHDRRIWDNPGKFQPERFRDWNESAYSFIPQGGGDYTRGHRCAGEWLTITLLERAARLLTEAMHYDVPTQNLQIRFSRMPAIPRSRFVISDVRKAR